MECIREIIADRSILSSNNKVFTEEENGDLENAIIAFYKLAEHTSLAIIQYSSLYEETEEELEQYRTNIKRADEAIIIFFIQKLFSMTIKQKVIRNVLWEAENKLSSCSQYL